MENSHKPVIRVKHKELERAGNSIYRSVCPVCKKGVLPVRRDINTFELLKEDNCFLCGQPFEYTDLEYLNKGERTKNA